MPLDHVAGKRLADNAHMETGSRDECSECVSMTWRATFAWHTSLDAALFKKYVSKMRVDDEARDIGMAHVTCCVQGCVIHLTQETRFQNERVN
jgi:hypothetical protein